MENGDSKKVQIFNLKVSELEINEIINMFMEFPAGRVYNLLRKFESQTTIQRSLPEDQKEFEDLPV